MDASPSDPFFYIADVLASTGTEEERLKYMKFATYVEDWIVLNGDGTFTDSLVRKYKFQELYKSFMQKEGYEVTTPQKDSIELHGYW
jgi:hypothetical protein